MTNAKKFASIFEGLSSAYIVMTPKGKSDSGKNEGDYQAKRELVTLEQYQRHLDGIASLGVFLLNDESMVRFGCIDIDQYPIDHTELVNFFTDRKLPLIVDRSKSGGAHCYLFCNDWMPASKMRETLRKIAANMGYGNAEVFPKQDQISVDRGDVGSAINLPYFGHETSLRYAYNKDGTAATLDEFFALYDANVQSPEQIAALTVVEKRDFLVDGPPCLQALLPKKIGEGGRNNGLFNIGVYLRKVFPDTWETELMSWNAMYVSPPLNLGEVNVIVGQLKRKDYAYKCSDPPINSYCDRGTCLLRKYGIGGRSNASMANLRKYDSHPPIWFLDVNGSPLELDTEGLMQQPAFQKACMEQLNFLPPSITKQNWETRIATLLSELRDNSAAVIPVAEEESTKGVFYEYLKDFCLHHQQAQSRDEIVLGKPWTDDDEQVSYFRLRDLEGFLSRHKFFEYKRHKVAQRLREIGGEAVKLRIQEGSINVYRIPAFVKPTMRVKSPVGGKQNDLPF